MRTFSYVIVPALALLNMGVNAATIANTLTSRHSGHLQGVHSRAHGLAAYDNRQVHNADFSSSTPATPASDPAPAVVKPDAAPAPKRDLFSSDPSIGNPMADDSSKVVSIKKRQLDPEHLSVKANATKQLRDTDATVTLDDASLVEEHAPGVPRGLGFHKGANVGNLARDVNVTSTVDGVPVIPRQEDVQGSDDDQDGAADSDDAPEASEDTPVATEEVVEDASSPDNVPRSVSMNLPIGSRRDATPSLPSPSVLLDTIPTSGAPLPRDVTLNSTVSAPPAIAGVARHIAVDSPVGLPRDVTVNSPVSEPPALAGLARHVSVNSPVAFPRDVAVDSHVDARALSNKRQINGTADVDILGGIPDFVPTDIDEATVNSDFDNLPLPTAVLLV